MIIYEDVNINEIINENITIKNSSVIHSIGIVNGNIYVENNSHFFLDGILNGDLIIKSGSFAKINGTMKGNIIASKGVIKLFGKLFTKSMIPKNLIKEEGCFINDIKY